MRDRRSSVLALVIALALGLSACGGDSKTSNDGNRSTGSGNSSSASAYVGLSKKAAVAKAEAAGHPWRITREDDQVFPATLDYNPDRVSFELDDGKVTQATFG